MLDAVVRTRVDPFLEPVQFGHTRFIVLMLIISAPVDVGIYVYSLSSCGCVYIFSTLNLLHRNIFHISAIT